MIMKVVTIHTKVSIRATCCSPGWTMILYTHRRCLEVARLRHANGHEECLLFGVDRKSSANAQTDANDRAPRGRELSVREGLTRIIVDWSGSWQAARPGNWLGRSPATKAALGC
jgi:hypothetical protein